MKLRPTATIIAFSLKIQKKRKHKGNENKLPSIFSLSQATAIFCNDYAQWKKINGLCMAKLF